MRKLSAWSLILMCLLLHRPAGAEDETPQRRVSIAVMEFSSKAETLPKEKMEALSDVLANSIRDAGPYKVIGKDDIRAALSFEQQRTLMGCDDESCIAELGGALGVDFIVVGNLSRFGESYLVNLKLINVYKVEVAKGVSRTLPGQEENLVAELPSIARELAQALKGQPTSLGAKVQAELQTYESKRAGAWPLSVSLGLLGLMPPYATNDGFAGGQLAGLNRGVIGGRLGIFAGYALLDWLAIGPRLNLASSGDPDGERVRGWIDGNLEVQVALPVSYWLRPSGSASVGFGKVWDQAKAEDSPVSDVDSWMINLEMAVGLDFMLSPSWVLGARFAAFLDLYPGLHEGNTRVEDTTVLALGLCISFSLSYEF